jgi:hypothetical protein
MPSDPVSIYKQITNLPSLIEVLKVEIACLISVGLAHKRIQELLQVGGGCQ